MRTGGVVGFELLNDSIAFGHARELVIMSHLSWTEARIWFVVVGVLLLGTGLLFWSLTQRNLWAAGPAARPADGAALVGLLTAAQADPPEFADTLRDQITRGWRTLVL
ncbi:hypothetical protein [Kitasatospora arboriphila]|uniref:Uncharacterized protein n=1 Tax=Kitasatospora arboriphila TaxID=258052 RepID=A0ABN1U7D1_9ACTN